MTTLLVLMLIGALPAWSHGRSRASQPQGRSRPYYLITGLVVILAIVVLVRLVV